MIRKILYISGTRADYGLIRSVLRKIDNHPNLSLDIVVTGMHLMAEFGNTIEEIYKDGFHCHVVDVRYEHDTKASMATFIGQFIQKLTPIVSALHPDIILVLGDRGEMLAGAIVGVYLSIPVAHIHGGEVTSTVDDFSRNAITKLAHIHFPATERGRGRIIGMGEDPARIFVVGAPGLDQILEEPLLSKDELAEKYQLDLSKQVILVVQHPVTLEAENAQEQIRETLEAVVSLQCQTVVIYPNADAGGRAMIETINEYTRYPFLKTFSSIQHRDYLSLLKEASVLVGNSSSAIIEAPSFGLPVVNIGTRQMGRERAINVIDADYNRDSIKKCIKKALFDIEFQNKAKKCKNPYGDGNASEKIVDILAKIDINKNILTKTMVLRFNNWAYPEITDGEPTAYHWIVKHTDTFKLGYKTDIGAFTYINAQYSVNIEDFVQIGSHCSIYSVSTIDNKHGGVYLRKGCRIGTHSVIMPGVTVGERSIIGAFSFVNTNIPAGVLAYGIPAKVERRLTEDELIKIKQYEDSQ